MHESEASDNVDSKHLRPLICAEEAIGFHKRVKRIHDPVKIVVPCAVFEVEFPIPPDNGSHLSSYIEVLDDHQHVEASQKGLRCRDEVDKGPTEAASVDTDQIPSNDTINRHRSTLPLHHRLTLDGYQSRRRYHHAIRQVWGKKRRNWKKRKRIKDGPQVSLIPHFSDGVRKSRVRNRCFSQPFATLRALCIAEMINKGEESMRGFHTRMIKLQRLEIETCFGASSLPHPD